MKIVKTRDVKTPTRGTNGSAGIDFYVPNDVLTNAVLNPNDSIKIPSGIFAKVPEGFALIAFNKSGVAMKGLQVGACVVDSDYQGEIHIHLTNVGKSTIVISPGDKIVQFLLLPVDHCGIEEVESTQDLYEEQSERGEGGFGSTGNK